MNNTSHTNIGRSRLSIPLKALSAFLAAVMFFWPVAPVMGRNLPSGWNVVKGQVTVTVNGKTMTVDQATAKAIVNWDSFDVGKGYTVDINQISTKAAMLARVVGANASEILGSLKATGGLYLVNPNGILFGSGAVIDVNRLIASTHDISNDDFWSGNLKFQGDSGASVVNRATINAESAALIGKNVENYGTINASQAALVGAAGPVKLDNFGNGANLSIDFSGLTGAHDTKVVNEGTINAAGGEAILTAEAGKGLVEANNGTVVASSAEFSGKNSAPSNLGNLTADRILLDPEGSIVIGSLQAGGYKGKDGTKYAEYHPKAGGEIPPTFDAPYSSSSNAECTTSNMTVYDKDGNGWTYTYSTEDVTDPLTGATRVQYNYGTPVCTYYNSKYLSGHLQTANWGFSYTSGGGWAGDVTFTRGEGENLEQIMIGGTFGLNLEAERNLGILDYVHFNNPNDIKLQGGNLVIGDFASVEALGNVSIIANTALANTGRLDITTPKRVELFINGGEAAFGTLNITSFEDDIFLRTSNLNVAGKLMLNAKHDIYATGEDMKAGNVNFTANAGDVNVDAPVTTKWMVLAAGRDVQINGAANTQSNIHITAGRDAVSTGALDVAEGAMTITAGRDATLAKLSTAHPDDYLSDVKVTAKNTVTLNGEVTGGRLWATATEGDVVIKAPVTVDMRVGATAGRDVISTADLTATDGFIEIIAGRDATLARLAAGPTSSVDVNAGNDVTLNGTVDAWFVIIDAKNNATLNDDVTGGERVHASAAEGDLVVNGDVTANGTFVELLAGRDAEINGNINATNGLYGKATITAKNNATINGTIKAGGVAATATEGDLLIAGDVTSTRNIHDDATTFTAGRDVKIDGSVTSAGRKNATIITAGRDIIATADIANADESITATAGRDVEFAKLTAENGDLTVTAKDNATFNGAVSANAVAITATEGDLVVKGAVAANDGSGKFVAGQDVKIVKDGNVSAKGDLTVEAGRDITSESDIASTEGKVALDAKNAISVEGEVSAAENVDLMATVGNVKVTKAITSTDESVTIQAGHDVDVEAVSAGRALAINAGQDVDTGALTAGNGTLLVAAARNITVGDISATSDDVPSVVLINSENGSVRTEGINVGGNAYVTGKGDVTTNGAVNADRSVVIGSFEGNVEVKGATGEDVTIKAVTGNVVADNVTANGADGTDPALRITAGRDIEAGSLVAADGTVSVEAKNNATLNGTATGLAVSVTATEGNLKATGDVKSTGGALILTAGQDVSATGLESELGNVKVTAGRDAAIAGETKGREAAEIAAGRDATTGAITADEGAVMVTAKNNATVKGAINGKDVMVAAAEGDLKAAGDIKSTGGELILTAGQDVFAAGLESELGNVNVTAGRDAAIAGETKAREAAVIAAGRDATTGAITADEDAVMVTAKNNATVNGAINGKGVIVAAAEGDATTGNIDAKSGHATVTAGQDATIGDVTAGGNAEIVAKRDATTGAITAADGSVTVVAKNNATIDGAINGRVVIVEVIEGDVSLKGDATASAGYLFVRAGQDAKVAADVTLKSETSYVSVVAGRDALVEGALEAEELAEVKAGRDATAGNLTAGRSARIIAKNNATANGDITASGATIRAEEGDASVNANVMTTTGHLILDAGHNVKVAKNMHLDSAANVEVKAGKDAILDGDITAEGGTATITATNDVEANGSVFAAEDVTINAGRYLAVRHGVTSETGAIKMDAATGDMNINAPNGVTAAKEITLEAGIGNINIEGDSTIKGTDVTIHTATGNVAAGKNTTVEATTDNILVDASQRADMLGTLKAENGSVTVKAGLGATVGTVIAKDTNIEANTGDIILEEDMTAGDINLDAKRGYVITKSLTATDDSITVNAGIDATLDGNLTAENGDVSVTAKNNAAITGTVTANEVTLTATEGDLTAGNDITANGRMATLAAGRDIAVAGGIKAPAGGVEVVAGRDASINGAIDAALSADVTAKNNATVDAVKGSHVILKATDGTLVVNGDVTANDGDTNLTAGHDVEVAGGTTLSAAMDVNVKAGRDAAIEGTIAATVNARVNAGHDAKVGAITAEQGDAIVDAGSNIEMNGNVSANNIYAFAKDESLVSNGVLAANGEVILNAGTYMRLNNDVKGGRVSANSIDNMFVDGNIEATDADIFLMSNRNAWINGTLKANTDVHVDAIESLDVFNTVDAVTGDVMLHANNSLQAQGAITAGGDAIISTERGTLGVYGTVTAAGTADIGSADGDVSVDEDVTADCIVISTTNGNASVSGNLTAEDSVTVQAGLDASVTGDVVAKGDFIRVTGGEDVSTSNLTAENGNIKVIAGNNADLKGAAKAKKVNVEATAGTIASIGTLEATDGDITLKAGEDVNYLHANASGNITADAGRDIRAYGPTTAGGDVNLTARGNLMSNGNGVIDAEGDAKLVAKDGDVILKATVNAKNIAIEAGRDANTAAELTAEAGDVIVTAGRDARLSRTTAEGDVIVEANSNVKLNGDVDASNIYVTAKEESLESNGVLTANGAIELFAGTHAYINNDVTGGNVRAITINNMFVDGNIEATDADIFLMSNRNAWINGTLKANTDVHVDAIESLDVFNTVDAVTGDVMLHANNSLQAQGAITAGGDAIISTERGTLGVYGTVTAAGTADIGSADGDVSVDEDVTADCIVISTTNGNASVSGNLTAEDSVTVQAGLDAKVDGDVVAKGDFIRVTGGRDVSTSNLNAENGSIKVIAGNNADLSNAAKAKEISVEATAGTIASVGTLEATDGDITLDAGKDVNYLHANASGNITADAGRDIRAYGPTTAGGDVKLTARGNLMSNDNGVIDAEGDAKLVAKDGDVTLKKATVNAKNVTIEAGHDVTTLAEVTAEAGDVTVTAGRDAALAKLTANAGDVTVTAKDNATFNGAVNATTVTATATEGDVNVKAPVTATEDDVVLTARRDVVIDGGVVVAERDVLLTATDGTVYIGETVTANTGNVQATAGKVVNVDASVEATEGDVNFKAASDVYIFDPVKAGKTIDIISLKGDVYTSSYGDLTAENGFIKVSALSGNVELAGDATAENGDVIIYAGKDIDIHATSNILAQNVNMTTAHGDVSNDGSIAAKGLEDSTVMVNANGNILNTGSIQADKAVQLISTKDIRNTGSIQAGTATEKPLTPGSVIEFNADGKATSTGTLVAETITGLADDDITITGELNTDYLNLKTTGSDGDITVETGHDIIAASLVTEGDQSDISFKGKNVDEMTAETKGTDADIDIKGGKMTIRKAVTFDGDVDIAGSGDLVLDVVEAKDGGKYTGPDRGEARHVNVTSGGMVKILTHVKADADVNIDARGPILDTDYAVITSGGDTSLTTGAYIGDVADGNPIHVEAEGTIYVNPRPGTPKVEYFAFVEGTSGDGQIHTKASSLPGLVVFNSVPWMGTKKQMGRLDRSYAEKFSAINGMLEVFNLSYPLVAEYRYFPHTILDLDGFTNAPRKGIEIIRMGGEKGGTINGLPEGLTPRNIPSVSDYEWTFLWPLDNEDADNAAEPVEATVSER